MGKFYYTGVLDSGYRWYLVAVAMPQAGGPKYTTTLNINEAKRFNDRAEALAILHEYLGSRANRAVFVYEVEYLNMATL